MPLLTACFPGLGLVLLLGVLFAGPGAGPAWNPATLVLWLLAGSYLSYRVEFLELALQPIVLGALAGVLGAAASTPGPSVWPGALSAAGLETPAVFVVTLMLLSVALTDQSTYHGLAGAWLSSRRPLVNGLLLAGLGLLAATMLPGGNRPPAPGSVLAAGQGGLDARLVWALLLFLAGTLHQELLDRWAELAERSWARAALASGLLAGPAGLLLAAAQSLPGEGSSSATGPAAGSVGSWGAMVPPAVLAGASIALLLAVFRVIAWLCDRPAAPTVLLTTVCAPFPRFDGDEYVLDYYSSRLSRGQGPFTMESTPFYFPTHYIARNLKTPSLVLDYPTLAEFEAELRRRAYRFVAIGFQSLDLRRVESMCRVIRRVLPASRIVLGGHGTSSLEHPLPGEPRLEGLYDHVCDTDGVPFLRRLLGEAPEAPRDISMPVQRIYPMGAWFAAARLAPVLAGLGCRFRCNFCATSAFFKGEHLLVATADEIVRYAEQVYERDPKTVAVPLFDEDFLDEPVRARRLADLLQRSTRIPAGAAPFTCFAGAASIRQYEPAELVRMGLRHIWVGVESRFAAYPKLSDGAMEELFGSLYDHGIAVTGSFIIGFDFHTPENLDEDIDWFVGLEPTTTQVALLQAPPGTALHRSMEEQGRIAVTRTEDIHLAHENVVAKNLPPGTGLAWRDLTNDRLYARLGPSVLRMFRVWLKGYLHMRGSADPVLRARAEHLRGELAQMHAAVVAVRWLGPNAHVKQLASDSLEVYRRELGPPSLRTLVLGAGATGWTLLRGLRLRLFGLPRRSPVYLRRAYQP